MKNNTVRARLMASSVITGVAFLVSASSAYAAEAAAAPAAEVSEIIVTGSRIPQPNLTSTSPIQVVSDKEFKLQGKTNVSDLVNTLPQQFQNSQADFSNTSNVLFSPGGTSTADLRGLGPQRTLVLVDGRRLGIGDANTGNTNPAPDLNQIPGQLVDRVEVLTGGSSAVYGSDAVAGVLNFVMKQDFEGIQIDGQIGAASHRNHNDLMQGLLVAKHFAVPKSDVWDGQNADLSVVIGMNAPDGKGNVSGYLTYHNQNPVSQGTRDFSACKLNVTGNPVNKPACSGSANSNEFIPLEPTDEDHGDLTVVGTSFLDWPQANSNPPPLFNSNAFQYLAHQDRRYTAGFFAHYDVESWLKLYSTFSFMNDRSTTQIAPSGLFEGGNIFTASGADLINCDNPLLSAQEAALICTPAQIASGANTEVIIGRRNVEGGGRNSYYEHVNYRAVVGAKGALGDAWHYDAYGSYYYTSLYQGNHNYLSLARIARALQVVNVGGVPTCKSKIDGTDPNCVPYNIFKDGGVTPDQVNYLNSFGSAYGTVSEGIVEASLVGDLGKYGVKSPYAQDGVGVALGTQYRRDTLTFTPDEAEGSGDLSGFGGAAATITGARVSVQEEYGEIRIPLVQKLPFFEDLLFEGGYRYSKYNTGVSANTYKVAGQWAPTEDIRFRVSYQQAIRAPSIIELFNPQTVTNTSQVGVDPCAPTKDASNNIIPATATLAECMHTGVTAAQYGNGGTTSNIIQCPASQCATLIGGNPTLNPERARTFSVGFTTTPRFLRGFSGSVDYYHINLSGTIASVDLGIPLQNCLATGAAADCSQIVRTPNGFLFGTTIAGGGYIKGIPINVGANTLSGIDFQAAYSVPLSDIGMGDHGTVSASFVGAYLLKSTTIVRPGVPLYDCAGLYGARCQTLNPTWRHTLRVSWQTPWNVLVSANWRYIGSSSLDTNSTQPVIGGGTPNIFNAKLPAVSYLDLSTIWNVRDGLAIRGGINNIFDKDPPLVSSLISQTGSPNTYPTYDLLGRTLFVGFTASF